MAPSRIIAKDAEWHLRPAVILSVVLALVSYGIGGLSAWWTLSAQVANNGLRIEASVEAIDELKTAFKKLPPTFPPADVIRLLSKMETEIGYLRTSTDDLRSSVKSLEREILINGHKHAEPEIPR